MFWLLLACIGGSPEGPEVVPAPSPDEPEPEPLPTPEPEGPLTELSDARWTALGERRPGATRPVDLVRDPSSDELHLVLFGPDGPGVSAWTWRTDHWSLTAEGLLADDGVDWKHALVAWADAGDLHVGRVAADGLHVQTVGGARRSWSGDLSALYPARADTFEHGGARWVTIESENEGHTYRLESTSLVRVGEGPYLLEVAAVPDGAVVGQGLERLYRFDGRSWQGATELSSGGGLTWHPGENALAALVFDGQQAMKLQLLDRNDLRPRGEGPRLPTTRNLPALGASRELVLAYGGQDFDQAGALSELTWFAGRGASSFSSDAHGWLPSAARIRTVLSGPRLLAANHGLYSVQAFEGTSWSPHVSAPTGAEQDYQRFDDRYVNFAAWGDTVWLLDAEGGVWKGSAGGRFVEIADGSGGPGGRYAGRVGLGWDPLGMRLVAVGGEERNDTWVFAGGRWSELRPTTTPPHGTGSVASTAAGLYLLIEGTLWRLVEDRWVCVGLDVPGHALHHDGRGLVTSGWSWTDTGGGPAESGVWRLTRDGPVQVTDELPRLRSGEEIGLDGASGTLLAWDEQRAFALKLPEAEGWLPTEEVEGAPTRPKTPPTDWTRPAAKLVPGEPTRLPDVGLPGLLAVLPVDPEVLPLPGGATALAIGEDDTIWNDPDARPWELGGGGYPAVLLTKPVAGAVTVHGEPKTLSYERYTELDPDRELEVDTPPGNTADRAWGSKVGGYPRPIQGDPDEGWTGPPVRFVAQLAADLVSVGDVGSLYVYVTDEPTARVLVTSQSH